MQLAASGELTNCESASNKTAKLFLHFVVFVVFVVSVELVNHRGHRDHREEVFILCALCELCGFFVFEITSAAALDEFRAFRAALWYFGQKFSREDVPPDCSTHEAQYQPGSGHRKALGARQ